MKPLGNWDQFEKISQTLTFYFCGSCGAMSMVNFRDDYCRVCQVAMNVKMVEIKPSPFGGIMVYQSAAPHTEVEEVA